MRGPRSVLASLRAQTGNADGGIVDAGQWVGGESFVVATEVGCRSQNASQPERISQPCLKSQTRMLAGHVARRLVVETKVRHTQAVHSFDERVAELMEDHLRKAVVGIQSLCGTDGHHTITVRRGIDLGRTFDPKPNPPGDRQPHGVEGIEVDVARSAVHCVIVADMKRPHCPICKKELKTRGKNFPFCSSKCKLVDAGNWFDGNYRIEADRVEPTWGEN